MVDWRKEIKETLVLGIPMAGAQLSQLLMTTTDVALVGRLRGEALAAMAVGQASYGMVLSLGIGLCSAIGPLVSQAHGAENRSAMVRSVAIGSAVALLLGLLCWPLLYQVDLLYRWLDYSPEMARLATGYTRAAALGLPFAFLFLVLKGYLDSVSRPRWPMAVAIIGILVNAAADYAFMYGYWGFPALGVTGTGLATSAVNLFMSAALLGMVWRGEHFKAMAQAKLAEWREFLAVGFPIAGSIGVEVGLFVIGALMMGKLGTDEAAAHQIVLTCAATTFMVPLGVSFAGSTRVGQAVGRRDFEAVRPAGLASMGVGFAFMVFTCLLFVSFPHKIVELFWDPAVEKSQAVQMFAVQLLFIAGVFQMTDGVQVTAIGALRGLKDVTIPMLIAGLSYWVVGLSAAVYLTFYTPLRHQGLWIGFVLGLSTAAVGLTARFLILSQRVCHDKELQRRVSVEAAAEA